VLEGSYFSPELTELYATMADPIITAFRVRDLRWPTSLDNIGSDPMNIAGENALGYLEIFTDSEDLQGAGWSFTNGQGNEYVSIAMILKCHSIKV
jgi:L-galactonate dehydratase